MPNTIAGPVVWVLPPVCATNPVEWAYPTGSAAWTFGADRTVSRTVDGWVSGWTSTCQSTVTLRMARAVIEPMGGGQETAQTGQQGHRGSDTGGGRGQSATSAPRQPERPGRDHGALLSSVLGMCV